MGLLNIVRPEPELIEEYSLFYESKDTPGAGYGFPCDKEGNLVPDEHYEDGWKHSYQWVQDHLDQYYFRGVRDYSRVCREPAYGECPHCHRAVYLERDYGHGIDCECGAIYNMSGQELAPRSQWEDRWDEDSTQPYNVEFGYIGLGDEY